MKCRRCRHPAEVKLPAHNSAFCRDCYLIFFRRRIVRTIERERMFTRDDRILVAVSGGKDSLALWEVLAEEGYTTVGFQLALGIGGYSERSLEKTQKFAEERQLDLRVQSLEEEDLAVPDMMRLTRRPACSSCGKAKRHYFDTAAAQYKCSVLATGHNLDDEAARLLGNVLRWQTDHLARQRPVMRPRHDKFATKVKPLYLMSEFETASYAFMRGIDYVVEECPNAAGASQLTHKGMLDQLESVSPGSKSSFVSEFLRRGAGAFRSESTDSVPNTCQNCGMPSFAELCSFCSLRNEIHRKLQQEREGATKT